MISQHDVRLSKDDQGWSPIIYRTGTTSANKNVVEVSAAVGDFDHKSVDDYLKIKGRIESFGLTYSTYSTWSSTPDELAFRVTIPFRHPSRARRHTTSGTAFDQDVFGGENDRQTKYPSRMFYRPACPPDGLWFAEHHDGLAIDPEKLTEAAYIPLAVRPEWRSASRGRRLTSATAS